MLSVRRITNGMTKLVLSTCAMTSVRHCSSISVGNIKADLDHSTGIAVLKWNHKPVNALGLKFLQDNLEIFRRLESDSSCRGIVVTSEIPKIFSGGGDMKEYLECDRQHAAATRMAMIDSVEAFRLSRVPLVAAINGHAPGSACILAVALDYRIMTSEVGTIGLNESQSGVPLAPWLTMTYVNLLGHRKAELSILHGTLYNAHEALAAGLVDDVAASDEELLRKAKDEAIKLASIPSEFRRVTKMQLQPDLVDIIKTERSNIETTVDQMMTARDILKRHMDNVRNRKN